MVLCWVGIPLLRFHPHPSQRRSIGRAIGLTACPAQRAAIFTMLLLARACPAYFRLGALFEASNISTTSEPTVPSGIVSFGPSRSGLCQPFKLPGARLLHDQKSGACARPVMVRTGETGMVFAYAPPNAGRSKLQRDDRSSFLGSFLVTCSRCRSPSLW